MLLLRSQLIQFVTHGLKLKARNFAVKVFGHDVDLRLQRLVIIQKILRRERLVREAHIHDRGRMPFGSRQIYQTALAEQINFSATLQHIFVNERTNFPLPAR